MTGPAEHTTDGAGEPAAVRQAAADGSREIAVGGEATSVAAPPCGSGWSGAERRGLRGRSWPCACTADPRASRPAAGPRSRAGRTVDRREKARVHDRDPGLASAHFTTNSRRAGDRTRTLDNQLGRLELYQLSYTRVLDRSRSPGLGLGRLGLAIVRVGGGRWIRTTEGISRQIYSLLPLATRAFLRDLVVKVEARALFLIRAGGGT